MTLPTPQELYDWLTAARDTHGVHGALVGLEVADERVVATAPPTPTVA